MIYMLGLPRSRTKWLSVFLATDKCKTAHEESIHHASVESIEASGFDVICDTALIQKWKELNGKIILIERSIDDVEESLKEIGYPIPRIMLDEFNECLQEAKKHYRCIQFDELKNEAVCKELFEEVTGEEFDRERWKNLNAQIIECSMLELVKDVSNNVNNLLQLYGKEG